MKFILVSYFAFFTLTDFVAAQDSDQFFLVVETNIYEQDHSIVKIYNDRDRLIYEEYIEGIYIDISMEKHLKFIEEANELFYFFMEERIDKD